MASLHFCRSVFCLALWKTAGSSYLRLYSLLGSFVLVEMYKENVTLHRYIVGKGRTLWSPQEAWGTPVVLDHMLRPAGLAHSGQGAFGHEWNKPWLGSGRVRGLD